MRQDPEHRRASTLTTALIAVTLLAVAGGVAGALPVGTEDHTDLQPGAPILPDGWLTVNTLHGEERHTVCTANFLFTDEDGNRYIGTAGHCAPVEDGVHTWAYPEGPVAMHGTRTDTAQPIGHFVFAATTLVPTDLPVPFVGFKPSGTWP